MELVYKSNKWDKEIVRSKKVWKQLGKPSSEINLENGIKQLSQESPEERQYYLDYIAFQSSYTLLANAYYMQNNSDYRCIDNIFLAGMTGCYANVLDTGLLDENGMKKNAVLLDEAIYQLIATGQPIPNFLKEKDIIIIHILNGDFEKAKILLNQVTEIKDTVLGIEYIGVEYLKSIYMAILEKNEALFKKELIDRIKKYRKNPVDWSIFIDFVSIALIKIAMKVGIECNVNIIEIPEIFFDNSYVINREKVKTPFEDQVIETLRQRGIQV